MMADDAAPEPLIEFFKDANINAVSRVVERARDMADKAGRQNASASRMPRRAGALVRCMNTAMAAYGRKAAGVSTAAKVKPGSGKGGAAGKGSMQEEGRHQLYVERAGALEHGVGLEEWQGVQAGLNVAQEIDTELGIDTPHRGPDRTAGIGPKREADPKVGGSDEPGREQDAGWDAGQHRSRGQARARDWVDAELSIGPELSDRTMERAAQVSIEDSSKAPEPRLGTTASFGTIGETAEERLRFWDLVHEHESDKGGRTQTRLVLELPHEATAGQRHEIVRRFAGMADMAAGITAGYAAPC